MSAESNADQTPAASFSGETAVPGTGERATPKRGPVRAESVRGVRWSASFMLVSFRYAVRRAGSGTDPLATTAWLPDVRLLSRGQFTPSAPTA